MTNRIHRFIVLFTIFLFIWGCQQSPQPEAQKSAPSLVGFTAENAERQREIEAKLMELPQPATFRKHLETITREPHVAGSAANNRVADYLAVTMARAGFEVEHFPYEVYLPPRPGEIAVEIVSPVRESLKIKEDAVDGDSFSSHEALRPGWNAFSGSGDVTAEIVYVNYGRKEDFEALPELGVDLKGKIALARYGGNFRGYKAKYAEMHGAAGLLIFSDPVEEDLESGNAYPDQNYINSSTIQRGSVLTLDYIGDPLTPFEPALLSESEQSVKRLDPADVPFHKIPVTPIPYESALKILQKMDGDEAPEDWCGGLKTTYRLTGGGNLRVRVKVEQTFELTPVQNVVGTLTGSEFPDEWIILGSHYDAWGFGAIDPNGGTAMLLTLAEALGELAQAGFRPRRTIKIAHWDAEEYGIIGSVEWVEQFVEELSEKAVAYINADAAVFGANFGSSSSPSLKELIISATKAAPLPDGRTTVFKDWAKNTASSKSPPIGNLGGGSDHVGFYSFIGVPSASLGFTGKGSMYHSNYDTFAWFSRFGDHEFVYGPALARLDGIVALRLANADILPYSASRYAADLEGHITGLEQVAESKNRGYGRFKSFREQLKKVKAAAENYGHVREQILSSAFHNNDDLRLLNASLIALEKSFVHQDGLPFSRWNKSLYASPDPWSGYASWMLPSLRYLIEIDAPESELRRWEAINAEALAALNARLEKTISLGEQILQKSR